MWAAYNSAWHEESAIEVLHLTNAVLAISDIIYQDCMFISYSGTLGTLQQLENKELCLGLSLASHPVVSIPLSLR